MNLVLAHVIRAILYGLGYFGVVASEDQLPTDDAEIERVVGAIILVGTFIWGIVEKIKLRRGGITKTSDASISSTNERRDV